MMNSLVRRFVLGAVLAIAASTAAALPQSLSIPAGEQRSLTMAQTIANVAVGDPEIANVNAVDSRQVLVTGKAPGITTLNVWVAGQTEPVTYQVAVGSAMPVADAKLATDDSGGSPAAQVQADLKVIEVSRRALKEAGLLIAKNTGSSAIAIAPPGSFSGVKPEAGGLTFLSNTGFQPLKDAFTL
jgi:pilus assembly protein CpaC